MDYIYFKAASDFEVLLFHSVVFTVLFFSRNLLMAFRKT